MEDRRNGTDRGTFYAIFRRKKIDAYRINIYTYIYIWQHDEEDEDEEQKRRKRWWNKENQKMKTNKHYLQQALTSQTAAVNVNSGSFGRQIW